MKVVVAYIYLLLGLMVPVAAGQVVYDATPTTAYGSYQRGLGGVINAQGQKNLSDSQAAINMTDARSNQIDNQVKSVNAYWEKKSIYSQHQQQQFAEIEQQRSAYMAKNALGTLNPKDFDRTTGAITWPAILAQSQYDQYRKPLDSLFKKRAYDGALSGDEYMQATTDIKEWRAAITAQKDEYPGPILDQMLRFVLKVQRELDNNLI